MTESEPDSGGRRLSVADILRRPDTELEAALAASADRWIAEVAATVPDLAAATEPFDAPLDAAAVLGELSTLAWSGAGLFESISAPGGNAPVFALSSPWDISEQLRAGASVLARQVHTRLPSIADLHDRLTAAWNVVLSVSVVLTAGDTELHVPTRSALVVVHGDVRFGSDAAPQPAGSARLVPAGTVSIGAQGFTVIAIFEMQEFGPRTILEQLSRSASHNPLFRADLPRRPDAPFTSYGGSLLDEPDTLGRAALAIYDDGVPQQARCWWDASLRFAVGPVDSLLRADEWRLRWPAPPAFGDRRLGWSGSSDDLVIAMAGHVVAIAPDLHDELAELAKGGSMVLDTPLFRVFADLGLLVPA